MAKKSQKFFRIGVEDTATERIINASDIRERNIETYDPRVYGCHQP